MQVPVGPNGGESASTGTEVPPNPSLATESGRIVSDPLFGFWARFPTPCSNLSGEAPGMNLITGMPRPLPPRRSTRCDGGFVGLWSGRTIHLLQHDLSLGVEYSPRAPRTPPPGSTSEDWLEIAQSLKAEAGGMFLRVRLGTPATQMLRAGRTHCECGQFAHARRLSPPQATPSQPKSSPNSPNSPPMWPKSSQESPNSPRIGRLRARFGHHRPNQPIEFPSAQGELPPSLKFDTFNLESPAS